MDPELLLMEMHCCTINEEKREVGPFLGLNRTAIIVHDVEMGNGTCTLYAWLNDVRCFKLVAVVIL